MMDMHQILNILREDSTASLTGWVTNTGEFIRVKNHEVDACRLLGIEYDWLDDSYPGSTKAYSEKWVRVAIHQGIVGFDYDDKIGTSVEAFRTLIRLIRERPDAKRYCFNGNCMIEQRDAIRFANRVITSAK